MLGVAINAAVVCQWTQLNFETKEIWRISTFEVALHPKLEYAKFTKTVLMHCEEEQIILKMNENKSNMKEIL